MFKAKEKNNRMEKVESLKKINENPQLGAKLDQEIPSSKMDLSGPIILYRSEFKAYDAFIAHITRTGYSIFKRLTYIIDSSCVPGKLWVILPNRHKDKKGK